jgi:hypothetical protein
MPIIKTVERDQYHTLPNTTCLFSTVDNCTHEQCSSNTRHYCLKECLDGAYSIDGKVVCGRPFCIPCTTHYGYEHMSLCPFCHPDSKYPHAPHNKVVSPPRSALRPATTPTSSLRSFSQSPGGEAPPAIKDLSDQVVKCEVLYCNHATFFNQILLLTLAIRKISFICECFKSSHRTLNGILNCLDHLLSITI